MWFSDGILTWDHLNVNNALDQKRKYSYVGLEQERTGGENGLLLFEEYTSAFTWRRLEYYKRTESI
jgi:hypothetical protein